MNDNMVSFKAVNYEQNLIFNRYDLYYIKGQLDSTYLLPNKFVFDQSGNRLPEVGNCQIPFWKM